MKLIYKYPLKRTETQVVQLPVESSILCVHEQHGVMALWALFREAERENTIPWTVQIRGTGQHGHTENLNAPDYVGTIFDQDDFVWHIFAHPQWADTH